MKITFGNTTIETNSIQCNVDEEARLIEITSGELSFEVNVSEADCLRKMLGQWLDIFAKEDKRLAEYAKPATNIEKGSHRLIK